jgi:esterase/lipase superfamily enzyme
VRKTIAVVFLLILLSYILGLVSGFYLPTEAAHLSAGLTRLLRGKVRPLLVRRSFNETICYVTDRKEAPQVNGNTSYLGQYASQVSYGLVKVQVPDDRHVGSALNSYGIKKVESMSSPEFVKSLQDQSAKPLVIWIHGYKASFNDNNMYCAQIAYDLNMDANILSFDWANSESFLGYARDAFQVKRSTKHLVDLLETISNEVKPQKIVIIAHSLGSQLVCLALQKMYNTPNAKNVKLDHVIFLAPNVDGDEFDQSFKSALQALVKRVTIYVSSDDNVLLLSKLLYHVDSIGLPEHFSADTNLDEIQAFLYYGKEIPEKIDLVDVSFLSKKDLLKKHRIFLDRPVLEDLFWLIHNDYPAEKRHLLKYEQGKSAANYWVIPP